MKHPELIKLYQNHIDEEHPKWREIARLCYQQDLLNRIVSFLGYPDFDSRTIKPTTEQLEKVFLILSGLEDASD